MNVTEELTKLKELTDHGVISEEEFAIKKKELLGFDDSQHTAYREVPDRTRKKQLTKNNKIIMVLVASVLIIVLAYFLFTKISATVKKNAICRAAEVGIAEVMSDYGLTDYKVTYASILGADVLCEDFEKLSDKEKYDLIKATLKLQDITVNGEKIALDCTFYVNSIDYYYYISPLWAKQPQNNYTCGGVYKYDGNRYCIYEED